MNKEILAKRYAGFSHGGLGGNPAGVVFVDQPLENDQMLAIAAEIGDSETVFATQVAANRFNIRYFAPEAEVDFCGHATVALGQAILDDFAPGIYSLSTNKGEILLSLSAQGDIHFTSLNTSSRPLTETELQFLLAHSNIEAASLQSGYIPSMVNAGNNHALLVVNEHDVLQRFEYDFEAYKPWMQEHKVVTLAIAYFADSQTIHMRNAFAFGGVYEDPATGSAAASISGYLRDQSLLTQQELTFIQGEDMGQKCVLTTQFSDVSGTGIQVGGEAYFINSLRF